MTSSAATSPARPTRPLGVWLLSAHALLFEGLYPAFAMTFFLIAALRSQLNRFGTLLLYLLVLRLLISLGVIAATFLAFQGRNVGRWSLLVLVTLNHVLATQNFPLLLAGPLPRDALPGLIEGFLKQVVVPVIYVWYLTRRQTRPFYETLSEPAVVPS